MIAITHMDILLNDCELVGDSHALRMGNVLHNRPYTKRQEGLAVSGCNTRELLRLIMEYPPRKHVVLIIGCNDILQTFKLPPQMWTKEFNYRKRTLLALLKQMTQYSCSILEVFPIPKLECDYGPIAIYFLKIWNLIIETFNGFGGIRMIKTHHLLVTSDGTVDTDLYAKEITFGDQVYPDYVHLSHHGYELILAEVCAIIGKEIMKIEKQRSEPLDITEPLAQCKQLQSEFHAQAGILAQSEQLQSDSFTQGERFQTELTVENEGQFA